MKVYHMPEPGNVYQSSLVPRLVPTPEPGNKDNH